MYISSTHKQAVFLRYIRKHHGKGQGINVQPVEIYAAVSAERKGYDDNGK